jgi:hypothetical protein
MKALVWEGECLLAPKDVATAIRRPANLAAEHEAEAFQPPLTAATKEDLL